MSRPLEGDCLRWPDFSVSKSATRGQLRNERYKISFQTWQMAKDCESRC